MSESAAATPAGGAGAAPSTAAAAQPQMRWSDPANRPPPVERLKVLLSEQDGTRAPDAGRAATLAKGNEMESDTGNAAEKAANTVDSEANAEEQAGVTTDDASDEAAAEAAFSTVDELAQALGWDMDRLMDLQAKTKIDGKEGTVRIRDLIKSHQLEGHLNQKLMAFADERKAFETERLTKTREVADRMLRMDAGLQTLERALAGEYASVDWEKLRTENPVEFNNQFVAYQQRYAQMQGVAQQIAAEQQQFQAVQQQQTAAYLEEQKRLMSAKIPEWNDTARRTKDKSEMIEYLGTHGLGKDDLESVTDHRLILVLRDALNWGKLQKAKPATLKKVQSAPRLLKPGTTQSRAEQSNLQLRKDQEKLRSTGKVSDAKPVLKRLLFS